MRRLIRLTLLTSAFLLIVMNGLLLEARRHPSNTHWLLLCQDDSEWGHYSGTRHLVRVSPGGGRLFQVTPPREDLWHDLDFSDEWVYSALALYSDEFGYETYAVLRVNRVDLHEEVLGWYMRGDQLYPRPNGEWLELDTLHRTMALYRMERPNQERILVFRFEQSNLIMTTNTPPVFSDDGQWMYFNVADRHSHVGDVYRVRLDGGDLTNLTTTIEPSLVLQTALFDAGWLIVQDASPTHVFYRMRLDGSDFTPLTNTPNRLDWVTWLPQPRLAVLRDHNTNTLLAVGLNDPTPVWQVPIPVQAAHRLPSGGLVIRSPSAIALIQPDGTQQELTPMPSSLKFEFLLQQVDWLYYYDESFTNRSVIGRVNIATGQQQNLATGQYLEVADVSPDNTWLILSGVINGRSGLYRLMVDGSGLVRMTNDHRRYTFMGFGPPIDRNWSALIISAIALGLVLVWRVVRG